MLDTNAVIAILKGRAGFLVRLRWYQPQDFGLPAVVAHELFYGAFRSRRIAENPGRVDALQFVIVDFDREDARQAGKLSAALADAGTSIGPTTC